MSIGQCEFLVGEFPYDTARFGKLGNIEAPDCQAWQRIDERKEKKIGDVAKRGAASRARDDGS